MKKRTKEKEQYSVFYREKNNNEMFPTSSKYFIINKRKFKYVFYNTKCCIYEYMFFFPSKCRKKCRL